MIEGRLTTQAGGESRYSNVAEPELGLGRRGVGERDRNMREWKVSLNHDKRNFRRLGPTNRRSTLGSFETNP